MVKLPRLSAALAALHVTVLDLVHGYALPEGCTGTCTNAHDPSIIRRTNDGTYFRFSTNGKIAVHTAPNITGPWTYKGAALSRGPTIVIPGAVDFWAPDVTLINFTYYLYYSISSFGSQDSAIGLATSPSLDPGTWTDLGPIGVSSDRTRPYNAIDGNLISTTSSNGTTSYYLTFGSFWNGIHQVRMTSPLPTKTLSGGGGGQAPAKQVSYNPSDKAQEGPYIFSHNGYFYLFVSRGTCCGYDGARPARGREYRITVCRSATVTGPFLDKSGKLCNGGQGGGTTVLESHGWVYGPGGQGVFEDAVLGPVLYYHYVDTRVGYADGQKRFGWNKMDFSSGWPVV